MSENLKKLREEMRGLPKRRIILARETRKVRALEREALYPYGQLAGMSQIEELERKTEEARKEEQRVKEQFKSEVEGALSIIRKDFNTLIEDEKRAVQIYEKAVSTYGIFGWRSIFSDILRDEKEHLEKLKICLQSIEDIYKKTGEIKSV